MLRFFFRGSLRRPILWGKPGSYSAPALIQQCSRSIKIPNSSYQILRRYSTKNSKESPFGAFLNSRVTFKLANVLSVGVIGTLVYYVFQKRAKRKAARNASKKTESDGSKRKFDDKIVVITGGAGDIGGSAALAFAREGASVFLVDLPQMESIVKQKCKELIKVGAKAATCVTADVTKADDVEKMVKSVADQVGHIDIFFNNAGIQGSLRPLHEQEDNEFEKVINVNIYGVFLGMKYVSRMMKESGRGGVIVNTASLAGLLGPANMAAYTASKFAVVGMTKTAAKDLAAHKIRVCAIAPGILEGKMWGTQVRGNALCRKRIQGDATDLTEEDIENQERRMIEGTPMKRLGKLSEVASVVTFLSSDDASYLTGVTIPIDGGRIP